MLEKQQQQQTEEFLEVEEWKNRQQREKEFLKKEDRRLREEVSRIEEKKEMVDNEWSRYSYFLLFQ